MALKKNDLKVFVMTSAVLFMGVPKASAAMEDSNAQRTKEFVVMGYEGIQFELRSGEGAYLRTLTDLLKTSPDRKNKTLQDIRSLAKTYPNIMDFAEHVIQLQSDTGSQDVAAATPVLLPTGKSVYSGDQLENALNHLTRGMKVTVFLKTGERYTAQFDEYVLRRLWLQGPTRKSFLLDDILGIDAPQL